MKRRKFKFSHSVLGLIGILALQGLSVHFLPGDFSVWIICLFAAVGAGVTIYVATEVIEEVRSAPHMFVLLSGVVAEFVLFFAFQYWHLMLLSPDSFPTLPVDLISLVLHSLMIFVFNPLYLPANTAGQALLAINIMGALGLVLFILQNVTQLQNILPKKKPAKRKAASKKADN